jgi:hypothetical protein
METSRPAGAGAEPSQPNYTQEELAALDNFLTTHPSERRLLKYLFEHRQQAHTLASLAGSCGAPVSLLDLKALVVYKLMEARDAQGHLVPYSIGIREDNCFTLLPAKLPLIEAALQRRKWSAPSGHGSGSAVKPVEGEIKQ